MSPGQMLPLQMSLWQLESVLDVPRNLRLKFHQIRVSNSWDIADFEFVWWVGWYAKSFSCLCLTQLKVMSGWVELWLSWGFDNFLFVSLTWLIKGPMLLLPSCIFVKKEICVTCELKELERQCSLKGEMRVTWFRSTACLLQYFYHELKVRIYLLNRTILQ